MIQGTLPPDLTVFGHSWASGLSKRICKLDLTVDGLNDKLPHSFQIIAHIAVFGVIVSLEAFLATKSAFLTCMIKTEDRTSADTAQLGLRPDMLATSETVASLR